jgi:hypothetical protein
VNDWWNDLPEGDEPPQCPKCGDGFGELVTLYASDGDSGECWQCDECGHRWPFVAEEYLEPEDFEIPADYEPPEPPALCPHGNDWAECNACMIAGDLAYDAAREKR